MLSYHSSSINNQVVFFHFLCSVLVLRAEGECNIPQSHRGGSAGCCNDTQSCTILTVRVLNMEVSEKQVIDYRDGELISLIKFL